MQELIEFVKDERFAHSNYTIELKAIELLEKEKEQIISAFEYGQINVNEDGCLTEENGAEEYYNQTYNHLYIVTNGNVGLSNTDQTTNNKLTISQKK